MRRLLILFILFLAAHFVQAQSDCLLTRSATITGKGQESELINKYNLNRSLIEETRTIPNSQGGGSYTTKKVFEYNEKGYLSKISEFVNDEFKTSILRTYDRLGNLISETEGKKPNGLNNIINKLTSSNGTEVKLYFDANNGISGKEVTEKNDKGDVVKYEMHNAKGEVNLSKEYKYNSSSKETYYKRNDVVGGMIEVTFSDYNNEGKIGKDSTFLNNKLIAKTLYTYTNGYLTKKSRYGRNNILEYVIDYSNNAQGKISEERFIYNANLLSVVKNTYDANGNLIEEKRFDKNNELLRTKIQEFTCPN